MTPRWPTPPAAPELTAEERAELDRTFALEHRGWLDGSDDPPPDDPDDDFHDPDDEHEENHAPRRS